MDQFPRKPLLDRIIVREIPLEEYYAKSDLVDDRLLQDERVKLRSDRGIVEAVGDCVPIGNVTLPMPVVVGDLVYFDEFCLYDPVFLNPADRNRTDLPKYWQMRVSDLKGVDVAHRNKIVTDYHERRQTAQAEADMLRMQPVGAAN